jgi:hypothetical protein
MQLLEIKKRRNKILKKISKVLGQETGLNMEIPAAPQGEALRIFVENADGALIEFEMIDDGPPGLIYDYSDSDEDDQD